MWGDDVIVFPYANPLFKALVRRAIKRSRKVTATSECLKIAVRRLADVREEIAVIPFGIDVSRFVYVDRHLGEGIRIGIAKTLRPKYGIDVLIDAFAVLSRTYPHLELMIAGRGEHESTYKRKVRDMNLTDRIRFTGFVDNSKLPDFLANIDIFVMPSVSDGESFGVAALEASATGLPVVASRVGGVPEVVLDNYTGLLVEKQNVEQLAGAIKRLIESPDLRRKMGRAGREFVVENYDWNHILTKMQSLYYDLMG